MSEPTALDREYRPREIEQRWAEAWPSQGLFTARPDSGRDPFCMVIPPPNVTGDLHIGHVLVYTLHDIVARWRRMQGRDVLWLPGTDHAGIATQMVVERELAREGTTRAAVGRVEFERRVWSWKELYGGRITRALRELGCSVDWTRERFTMDEGLSRAVRTVFVQLYRDGLVYRDRYIVNWCPRCRTALSDLETVHQAIQGTLYTLHYPAGDGSPGLPVVTTRPETLFGDVAVAVHPDDPRWRDRIGGTLRLPLTDRVIPIVADTFVDPTFGSGAVKITPAHDPNDFHAARRLGLAECVAIDETGHMTEVAGPYRGLERFEARRQVVAELARNGTLVAETAHEHAVGHCQRCATIVEPLVSRQWFVRIEPLARPAIEAVEQGRTRFVPESWTRVYFEWMRNIHDWCISRQLWWGHRIPAWYCADCGATVVAEEDPARCSCGGALEQDPDVLDTWFSSALWPFSTLGWPDATPELARYYPTALLITGHDIIFFWVARMLMLGLRFRGDVPFREVYIHGLVRDAQGQKMSKTRGNTIAPRDVQERYGTDALRFTMAILAAPGNDIPLAPERMEGYRAFANKLWNAARFVLLRASPGGVEAIPDAGLSTADRWILSRLQTTIAQLDRSFEAYRFDHAADAVYHFVWHELCDWYIEMAKPELGVGSPGTERVGAVLLHVLDATLRLLHPFMPFITEELWHKLPGARSALAVSAWPVVDPARLDPGAEAAIERLRGLVVGVRHLRAESGVTAGRAIEVWIEAPAAQAQELLDPDGLALLAHLVRASEVRVVASLPDDPGAVRATVGGLRIALPLAGVVDVEAERERLQRELLKVDKELGQRERKLADVAFLERAPAPIVAKERRVRDELAEQRERLRQSLGALEAGGA